jgi:hypothetical protein
MAENHTRRKAECRAARGVSNSAAKIRKSQLKMDAATKRTLSKTGFGLSEQKP